MLHNAFVEQRTPLVAFNLSTFTSYSATFGISTGTCVWLLDQSPNPCSTCVRSCAIVYHHALLSTYFQPFLSCRRLIHEHFESCSKPLSSCNGNKARLMQRLARAYASQHTSSKTQLTQSFSDATTHFCSAAYTDPTQRMPVPMEVLTQPYAMHGLCKHLCIPALY